MTKDDPELAFNLHVVKSFLGDETCRELIDELRRSVNSPALIYKHELGEIDRNVRRLSRITPSPGTIEYVKERLVGYVDQLSEHFRVSLTSCEEPQFLCYRAGDFFVRHQDGNTGLVQLSTDRSRRISVTLFLNPQSQLPESDGYSGGSLVFSDWRNSAEFEMGGEAGTLVAFPSEVTHEVTPVTRGERYSIVTWYGLQA